VKVTLISSQKQSSFVDYTCINGGINHVNILVVCLLVGVNDKSDRTVSYEYSTFLSNCRSSYKVAC